MSKPRVLNPPERIFLQVGEIEETCEFDECNRSENVTWCQDAQFDTDVEYRLVRPSKYRERPVAATTASQSINAEGLEPPCECCGGSGRLTIYDTDPRSLGAPIGDEPCPECTAEGAP